MREVYPVYLPPLQLRDGKMQINKRATEEAKGALIGLNGDIYPFYQNIPAKSHRS